jgi:hypothetical protein
MKPTAPFRDNISELATDPRPWLISFSRALLITIMAFSTKTAMTQSEEA